MLVFSPLAANSLEAQTLDLEVPAIGSPVFFFGLAVAIRPLGDPFQRISRKQLLLQLIFNLIFIYPPKLIDIHLPSLGHPGEDTKENLSGVK